MRGIAVEVAAERWPIRGAFRIARGAKTEAEVVVVTLTRGDAVGRGECVPYARYGETSASVCAAVSSFEGDDLSRLPRAAQNALDAALLDLEAKETGVPVWTALGLPLPGPTEIAWTLSIDTPEAMARAAAESAMRRLKVKLAGDGMDLRRLEAIRAARPDARLWLDANEGLDVDGLAQLLSCLPELGVDLLEQPLPEGGDGALATLERTVPICADESFRDRASLEQLRSRYDAVNVKLDKAGGPREALRCIRRARELGFRVVLGCMVSTSLSIAPALCLAHLSDDVDLDGALLLERDREGGPRMEGGRLVPAGMAGWGR